MIGSGNEWELTLVTSKSTIVVDFIYMRHIHSIPICLQFVFN